MKTGLFKIGIQDIGKALITALTTGAVVLIGMLIGTLSKGVMPTVEDFKSMGAYALAAALGYILKNMLTNNDGKFLKTDSRPKA